MAKKETQKVEKVETLKEEKKVSEEKTNSETKTPKTVKMQKGDKVLNIYNSPECIKQAESEGCILLK